MTTNTTNTTKPTKRLTSDDVILLFDGSSGVYIPQRFAQEMRRDCLRGVDSEDLEILERGPTEDNEWYWEAWDSILTSAELVHNGHIYYFYQDGGPGVAEAHCWAVPVGVTIDDGGRFVDEANEEGE